MEAFVTWIASHDGLLSNIAMAVGGYIVAWGVSYLKLIQDLNFIKGQLSQILTLQGDMKSMAEKHDTLERDVNTVMRTMEGLHIRVMLLEKTIFKEESHGTSA